MPSEPAGNGPSTRTARAPAATTSRTASGDDVPRGSSTAAPPTRLKPDVSKSRASAAVRADDRPCRARQRDDRGADGERRVDDAAEGLHAGDEHAQPGEQEHMAGGAAAARVDRADGERCCGAAGAADAAVRRARRPVVPGRRDHERVEHRGARRGPAERAVLEGRKGLDDADQRDPRGVVGIAVGVGIDGQLHPGQNLIGAAVDGDTAGSVRLPSRDADRQQRGTRRDALQPRRAARTGDETCHLRAVALRAARLGRVLPRARVPERVEHVETAEQRRPDVGVDEVDAGVEQGDGDAGAREARDPEVGPAASRGAGEVVDRTGIDGCRDGGAHRVDALHVGVRSGRSRASGHRAGLRSR